MIIGFCGKAGSGKDTAAAWFVKNAGFRQASFAAGLKNMLSVAGLPEPANRDDKEKLVEGFNFTWREAAQTLGTEWGRNLDTDIWVKLTMNGLDKDIDYVFSDVRFDNEAGAIRDAGGLVIELRGRKVDLGNNSGHPSEHGISTDFLSWIVDNNGSMSYLEQQLNLIRKDIKGE